MSFGFIITQYLKEDKRCLGYFAIEPFINMKYLKMGGPSLALVKILLEIICVFKLEKFVYYSGFFKKSLLKKNPKNIKEVDITLQTINPITYFKTGKLILNYYKNFHFKNKPYILVINPNDGLVRAEKTIALFNKNKCLTIYTTAKHYPDDMSEQYFKEHIKVNEINKLIAYLNKFDPMILKA